MNKQELDDELKKAETDYNNIRKAILIKYCKSNNKVNIGDIVGDHYQTILVERVIPYLGFRVGNPCMCCEGKLLKKDLTINRKVEHIRHTVFQCNMKLHKPQ